ncbi:ninjurin-A [Battus philenor]|uniref:ninjurin-A n=1 Tax=Battus philenor TaxID=42288 RepID=UPI0035CF088D
MSDHTMSGKTVTAKESHDTTKPLDLNDIEMVFGTPNSPKSNKPDVHLITNERNHGRGTHHNNHNNGLDSETTHPSQPLLEPDRDRPKPPLAGPEIDDLDDEKPTDLAPYPGIDDGFLTPEEKNPDIPHEEGDDKSTADGTGHTLHDDGVGTDDGKWLWPSTDETDYPYGGVNGLEPRFGIDDRPGSPFPPGTIPDVNTYQQKKNLAQGMMDLALLSANANQLRYVLESASTHPYYYPSVVFIILSIIFQIAVGVGLIMNSRYNVKDEKDICKADKINNMTVLGIFLITIVNVFITSFSVSTPVATVVTGAVVQQAG